MPQDSLDRIREALTRLPTCNRAELNAEWLRFYRTKPPARLGRNLLMAAIAYRVQEQVLGGLQPWRSECGLMRFGIPERPRASRQAFATARAVIG